MTDVQNPTDWSDYDFLEFEGFVSKVDHESFLYAADNYGPEFEDPKLQAVANSLDTLRAFYQEHRPKVNAWYDIVGMEQACDLHNAHVDEERKRKDDACLFGIRCTDGFVITCDSKQDRDGTVQYLQENKGRGWREPAALLSRSVVGGEWTEERAA
jgi:hypothetical protein